MLEIASMNALAVASPINHTFLADVIDGLAQPQKSLPPKYFYDTEGSHFFDAICQLDEYYPYRTEMAMLPRCANEVADRLPGVARVVEFGAGALRKIELLLNALPGAREYIAVDIAGDYLRQQTARLQALRPGLRVVPLEADFCHPVRLPPAPTGAQLGFFPGSTIGNFLPAEARQFLINAGATLGSGSHLLIGVDTKKSANVLHRAYNDSERITAAFNLNILKRINQELDGDFDLQNFEHYAYYNARHGRVEMHLVSRRAQVVRVAGQPFEFACGESIHTENSYKYTPEEFAALAAGAGWQAVETWLSPNRFFSLHLLARG